MELNRFIILAITEGHDHMRRRGPIPKLHGVEAYIPRLVLAGIPVMIIVITMLSVAAEDGDVAPRTKVLLRVGAVAVLVLYAAALIMVSVAGMDTGTK